MRRHENYYYIILLNKNINVRVRFLFIKNTILIPCLYRDFKVQKEVHIEYSKGGEAFSNCFPVMHCPTRISLVIYVKIFRVKLRQEGQH